MDGSEFSDLTGNPCDAVCDTVCGWRSGGEIEHEKRSSLPERDCILGSTAFYESHADASKINMR